MKTMLNEDRITERSSGTFGPVTCLAGATHAPTPNSLTTFGVRSSLGVKMYRKRPNTLHVRFSGKGIKPSAKTIRSQVLLICKSITDSCSAKIEKWCSELVQKIDKTCARIPTIFSSETALSNIPLPLPSGLPIVRVDERLHGLGVSNWKTIDLGQ